MSRPRVATVLSAREWEATFVTLARTTSLVRLITRAYEPADLDRAELDVIVAGAETPWVTPAIVKRWRARGLAVVGLYPPLDRPGRRLLTVGGADEVLPDTTPPERVLQVVRTVARPKPAAAEPTGLIAVTGGRGAPGTTEVALGLAWGLATDHRTLLIDLDREGPSLSLRLGVHPEPDVAHAADQIMWSGRFPAGVRRAGPVWLLSGPPVNGSGPLSSVLINEVVEAAGGAFRRIVVDLGVGRPDDPLLYRAAARVFVCEASPKGLTRAAAALERWAAPLPSLVLNGVPQDGREDSLRAARRWLGLEPAVEVPRLKGVSDAVRRAEPPDAELVRRLAPLHQLAPIRLE